MFDHLNCSIDRIILDRGRDYVWAGYVRSIVETSDGMYRAEVEGSELYEVLVELGVDNEVIST